MLWSPPLRLSNLGEVFDPIRPQIFMHPGGAYGQCQGCPMTHPSVPQCCWVCYWQNITIPNGSHLVLKYTVQQHMVWWSLYYGGNYGLSTDYKPWFTLLGRLWVLSFSPSCGFGLGVMVLMLRHIHTQDCPAWAYRNGELHRSLFCSCSRCV